ncbi:MAG TPA: LTA synthase family protein, partial [Polyangiaceae bacterium]|nr:LTA synthase family protein [Polyangiaceae bacterium]
YALWPRRAFLQVAIPSIVASFGLVLIISGYSYWQGGVCFGPRHLVPSIPLIALGLAHIPQTWLSKPWFWVVASLSFGVNLLGVATTPFIAERQTAPLSLYLKLAKEGALALNPSGFMAPSSERRWRWAAMAKDGTGAFNLGETLGLQGWWSLLPWLLVVVILMVVFVYIVKPRGDQDEHRNRGSLSVAFILEFFSLQMLKNTIKSSISFRTKRGQGGVLRIASAALFFFSLLLLRFQVVQDLGTGVRQAFHQGLITGIFADFFLTLLVLAGAWCAAWMVVPELFWLAFIALGVVVWSAEIAGVLYYSFFGEPLEWWIVVRQSAEIPLIVDSALALGRTPFIVGSALLLLSSLGLSGFFLLRAWRIWRKSASPPTEESPIPAVPAKTSLFPGLLLGMISVLFMNSLASSSAARGLLDESTVTRWWRQASGHDKEASRWPNVRNPAQQLIIFRQLESGTEPQNLLPAAWLQPTVEASSSEGNPWPLARRLSFEPKDIAEMREPLGIPTGAMVNMIVIFVESWRSFEFEHPRLGPLVFPRLRARFAQQATYFPFTYASIYPEASTARGQYSALCSSLPNLGGPPVFLRFTGINVQCLPQLMGNGGYHTVLMSAGANEFHKTKAFFSTHGVQTFVGREYFRQFDDPDRVGTWPQQVLSDRPFLHEALQLLEHPNQEQPIRKPFLAVLATLSSHHPYVGVLPDVDLPGADRDYLGYLATLHYVDEALDLFLSELFSTQLADDTLVALIGDHGIRLPPVESLTKLQQLELISRVPMALITAKPQSSRRIPAPVHQMDLAPILTAIAGVPGKVSWIGRNALLGSGSPWVSSRHDSFAYRLGPHECFGNPNERPRCYHLKPGQDPLFDQNLEETDEVPTLTSFMHRVVKANQRLIQYDLLAPPDAEP